MLEVLLGLWNWTDLLRGWGVSAWSAGSKHGAEGVEQKHNDIPWLYFLAGLSGPLSQGQENCLFLLHF